MQNACCLCEPALGFQNGNSGQTEIPKKGRPMKMKTGLVVVAVLLFTNIKAAYAAQPSGSHHHEADSSVLITAPLTSGSGSESGSLLQCNIVNVSDDRRDVKISTLLFDVTILGSSSPTLEPGHAFSLNYNSSGVEGYCKFDVRGCAEDFRANACVSDMTQRCSGTTPAQ